jgi:hypothetical protein
MKAELDSAPAVALAMTDAGCFLAEKKAELKSWEALKRDFMGGLGGRGYVDPDVVPLVDRLNRLDGVYTLQSCAGHSKEDADGANYSGVIWLRLAPEMTRRFENAAQRLAADPRIERVGKIYWEDGKETVTISFKGNESGLLAESSAIISRFFEALSR